MCHYHRLSCRSSAGERGKTGTDDGLKGAISGSDTSRDVLPMPAMRRRRGVKREQALRNVKAGEEAARKQLDAAGPSPLGPIAAQEFLVAFAAHAAAPKLTSGWPLQVFDLARCSDSFHLKYIVRRMCEDYHLRRRSSINKYSNKVPEPVFSSAK